MTDRRPGRKKRRLIQGYWLAWIGANAVAWTVGFALAQAYARAGREAEAEHHLSRLLRRSDASPLHEEARRTLSSL